MAIYFTNSNLKQLSAEQLHTLGLLADAAQAETVNEQDEADRQAMADYCKQLAEKAAAEQQAQHALVSSFI